MLCYHKESKLTQADVSKSVGVLQWPDFEALRRFTIVARSLASQLQKTKDTYGGWFLPVCKYLKRDCTGCYSDHECQQTAQEEQSTGLDVTRFDFLPELSLTDIFGCQRPVLSSFGFQKKEKKKKKKCHVVQAELTDDPSLIF